MKILAINPPHPAIGSRIPDDHLPPLGLLAVGGPLIDDGHDVVLLDCEFGPMPLADIRRHVISHTPDLILIGHSGSTSGHPVARQIAQMAREAVANVTIVYGGVFPTYHWRDVLAQSMDFDVIVRGEGEETCRQLIRALVENTPLTAVNGIAFRQGGHPTATAPRAMISDLDAYRIGWELIDFARYSYWGGKRAVVIQFSRGCPHPCNYCGQRGFWTKWRHRNPEKLAAEIARLHREHGVEVFNFADENPTSSRRMWKRFLEALIDENVDVTLVGSTRADDIVRDADILHLYKKAGVERFLMGMENTDENVLKLIKKGGSINEDKSAIQLMRKHAMLSMVTWVVGFEEETDRDYWRTLKQLLAYDPDQIQSLYITPHRWTPYFSLAVNRRILQPDQSKWDYKHQVLATNNMAPWRVLVWVKAIETIVQMRPRALWRLFTHKDPKIRHAQRWYYQMGRRVWFHELFAFLFHDVHLKNGPSVGAFWGATLEHEEEALARRPASANAVSLLNTVDKSTPRHELSC